MRSSYNISNPSIPEEVISQWFAEHPRASVRWQWIRPFECAYNLESWATDRIMNCRMGDTELMQWFSGKYEADPHSPRYLSIANYLLEKGTWPKPPLLLSCTSFSGYQFPEDWEHGFPYIIVEGHHRLAVLLAHLSVSGIKTEHSVWIVSSKS